VNGQNVANTISASGFCYYYCCCCCYYYHCYHLCGEIKILNKADTLKSLMRTVVAVIINSEHGSGVLSTISLLWHPRRALIARSRFPHITTFRVSKLTSAMSHPFQSRDRWEPCRMRSNNVTCYPSQAITSALTTASKSGSRFTYPAGMKG